MSLVIRRTSTADLPAILEIERQSTSAAHWTSDQYARRIDNGMVLVAELDGSLAGFVCANTLVPEWEIENIVVARHTRRCGIADALMRELAELAKSHAGTALWLEVRESNCAARSLYEKHGFRETGRRRDYYQQPVEDAVLYEWRIGSG